MSIPYTTAACELIKLFSPTAAKTTHMCVTLTPTFAKFTAAFCGHQIEAVYEETCRFAIYTDSEAAFKEYTSAAAMKEAIRVEAEAIIENEGEKP